jgi:hypothetical protein
MIPASTALSMLQAYRAYAGQELVAWNSTSTVHVRRRLAYFRKDWQARRDEIAKE